MQHYAALRERRAMGDVPIAYGAPNAIADIHPSAGGEATLDVRTNELKEPNSDGLQPASNGLQPTSDGLLARLAPCP